MTTRKMQQRSVVTRTSILDAARILFARNGYAGTSINDIVADADVTKGSVYHHFASKADIAASVLADWSALIREMLVRAEGSGASPLHQIVMVCHDLVSAHHQGPAMVGGLSLMIDLRGTVNHPGPGARAYHEWVDGLDNLVARAIDSGQLRQGPQTRVLGETLCSTLMGSTLSTTITEDPRRAQKQMSLLLRCLFSDAHISGSIDIADVLAARLPTRRTATGAA